MLSANITPIVTDCLSVPAVADYESCPHVVSMFFAGLSKAKELIVWSWSYLWAVMLRSAAGSVLSSLAFLFCFLIRFACCLETLVASVLVVNLLLAMLSLSSVSKKLVVSISLLSTELA